MHLKANGLLKTISKSETTSDEQKAKAMIFLRHHIHDGLKDEYIMQEDPADLWQSLKERFDHQKYVILPKARHEWLNLRFQDYKSVSEYNSALFGITSRMMLCGEKITDFDIIEKTLSTFHPGNVILQQQYRAKGFTKYSELMQILLVAEQNNELVMLNHQTRPTGSMPFPEVNVASSSKRNNQGRENKRRKDHFRGRGRGRVRGRGRGNGRGRGREKTNDDGLEYKRSKENGCFRCGMKGHWVRTCRTPKYLADMYQESQKAKDKDVETNFISKEVGPSFDSQSDYAHLDVADFLVEPKESTETNRLKLM
ncbi:uncharacterized protein LOC111829907 [Capsella rubella]|uniref:uncharacterized protein LOC111829907 n=1 Tax=Capsella rubella TaxID=81985 RepID=UPI000CD4A808|nr:uncharacterized protein LOC111829907 [Capsella rubella]